jgi:hypothetical protein
MGAIHFSLHDQLLECLKRELPLDVFFETGTFRAGTTRGVAHRFEKVYTVELSPELHRAARDALNAYPNVTALEGSSPAVLRRYRHELADKSVLYWLDAHWCGTSTAGDLSECPLLEELDAIQALNQASVILVDDARLFLGPPPHPHKAEDWPTICQVTDKLRALSAQHDVWIINDVLIFAPVRVAPSIVAYGRNHGVDLHTLAQLAGQSMKGVGQPLRQA